MSERGLESAKTILERHGWRYRRSFPTHHVFFHPHHGLAIVPVREPLSAITERVNRLAEEAQRTVADRKTRSTVRP